MNVETLINGVTVTCSDESVVLGKEAKVVITAPNGSKVAEVRAVVESRQGADGGWYPAVVFKAELPVALEVKG